MISLEVGVKYNRQELAEWFGISPTTFTHSKDKKLEELEEYGDFEIFNTKTGKFSYVIFSYVHCDTYYRSYRDEFLKSLKNDNLWEKTGEDNISNCTVVTNYYCHEHKLPYDGPHFVWYDDIGTSDDGKRKIVQRKKKPNSEFKLWHYLYNLARRYYYNEKLLDSKIEYDMSAGAYNPIYLRKTTEEMKNLRDSIYGKYFGESHSGDWFKLNDLMEESEGDMISKSEIRKIESIAKMSDKEKLAAAKSELLKAEVLERNGVKKIK